MTSPAPTISITFRPSSFTAKGRGNLGIIAATLIFVIFVLGLPLVLAS